MKSFSSTQTEEYLEFKRLTLLTNQIWCRCMKGVTDRSSNQFRWLPKPPNLAHRSTSFASQPPSTVLLLSAKQKNSTVGTGLRALTVSAGNSQRLLTKTSPFLTCIHGRTQINTSSSSDRFFPSPTCLDTSNPFLNMATRPHPGQQSWSRRWSPTEG